MRPPDYSRSSVRPVALEERGCCQDYCWFYRSNGKERLLQSLDGGRFRIECESNAQRAREILGGPVRFDLVFLDAELSDGVWQNLLTWSRQHGTALAAVICARLADHQLWAEVLQSGAYDLLVEPFEHNEVTRIVDGALNSASLVPPPRR